MKDYYRIQLKGRIGLKEHRNKRNICKICHESDCYEEKAMSNYDRIVAMDIVELAKFIGAVKCNTYMGDCGYPACVSMEGRLCVGMQREADADILAWLQKKIIE